MVFLFYLGHISNLFIGLMKTIPCIITGTNLRDKSEQKNMLLFIKLSFVLAQISEERRYPKMIEHTTVLMISERADCQPLRHGDVSVFFCTPNIRHKQKNFVHICWRIVRLTNQNIWENKSFLLAINLCAF